MRELNQKYVFHVPLCKFEGDELIAIDIDDLLDDLICCFNEGGFDGLYMSKVKSIYKSRRFDELTVTIFTESDKSPEIIFTEWFRKNNHVLNQEAFAYECNEVMIIESL